MTGERYIMRCGKISPDVQLESVDVEDPRQMQEVKEIVWEYFCWGNSISVEKHGFDFDISQMLVDFLESCALYIPPQGQLYLLRSGDVPVGTGGFKRISETACELKRMYVKNDYRKNGLGSKLLQQLIEDARDCGYHEMQLESAKYMKEANNLYTRFGFQEVPIYAGVESPQEYRSKSTA